VDGTAQNYYTGRLGPELFPVIGGLPGPASGSHILSRGTRVAPLGQPQLTVTLMGLFGNSGLEGPHTEWVSFQRLKSRKQVTSLQ
jgi:hypothetical protein